MRVEAPRGAPYPSGPVPNGIRTASHPKNMTGPPPHHGVPRTLSKGIRAITLTRGGKTETYGFHLKGGKEHGTGFFISHVEAGSMAQKKGIKPGDQLLEVHGMPVAGLMHREVADAIAGTTTVILLLRDAGIIPIKERSGDPLTWLMVEESKRGWTPKPETNGGRQWTGIPHHKIYRVVIPAPGKTSLGFSVTHDPSARSGIFVQTVKRGGLAASAGLRVRDQLLSCNGVDLSKMDNKQAIDKIKSQSHIVLEVRRAVRPELLTGESSGYNSSASSTAGEQTPPLHGHNRSRVVEIKGGFLGPHTKQEHITSRLSAVSHRLEEREHQMKNIDGEWATAEAAQKRQQLNMIQRNHQKQQNGPRKGHPMSRSASDLLEAADKCDSSEAIYYSSAVTASQTSDYCSMRPSQSSSSIGGGTFRHNDRIYNPSCTSDDDSVANTVYSAYRHRSSSGAKDGCYASTAEYCRTASNNNYSSCGEDSAASDGSGHKIALMTSNVPHVSNIVVSSTARQRDDRDALSRLDQLSCVEQSVGSQSQHYASPNELTEDYVEANEVEKQLKLIQEQKRRLAEEEQRLVREKNKFEDQRRLHRTQSAPGVHCGPLVIPCDSSTSSSSTLNNTYNKHSSLLSNSPQFFQRNLTSRSPSPSPHCYNRAPPSPTPSSVSGRHTSRVHIKSDPPAPPKRHTSTTLTRYRPSQSTCCLASNSHHSAKHSSLTRPKPRHDCHCHHHNYCRPHSHHHRCRLSPPSSPSSSSGVSCGSNPHQNSLPRRCKSFDELSHSSNEDPNIWEEVRYYSSNNSSPSDHHSSKLGGIIPPPPIPSFNTSAGKLTPATSEMDESGKSDLASALSLALKKRNLEVTTNGGPDTDRAEAYEAKINAYKSEKPKPADSKMMQHVKLMEEFKMKHKKMFQGEAASSSSSSSSSSSDDSVAEVANDTKQTNIITLVKADLKTAPVAPPKKLVVVTTTNQTSPNAYTRKTTVVQTKSVPTDAGATFNSKILRSLEQKANDSTLKKNQTVIVSPIPEESSEQTGALNYWKKKEVGAGQPKTVVVTSSVKRTQETALKPSPIGENMDNHSQHTQVKLPQLKSTGLKQIVEEASSSSSSSSSSEDENETGNKMSASELIKTFNSASTTKGTNESTTIVLAKKTGGTKGPAPQPNKKPQQNSTTYVPVPGPQNLSGMKQGPTTPGRLVKTQSWSERYGYGDWGHTESSILAEANLNQAATNDPTSQTFKAMFSDPSLKPSGEKPRVSIDTYSSAKKLTPQKINFLQQTSATIEEERKSISSASDKSSASDEEKSLTEKSFDDGKTELQKELESTLDRSNLRDRAESSSSSSSSSSSE